VVIKKAEAPLNSLEQVVALLGEEQLDVVVIEGFRSLVEKREDVLKIVTAKDADELKRTLEETAQPVLAVSGVIAQQKLEGTQGIPVINMPVDGERLLKLVKEHLKKS
jgi:molybdopterin-guanine dinucleotide biosynthesis protein